MLKEGFFDTREPVVQIKGQLRQNPIDSCVTPANPNCPKPPKSHSQGFSEQRHKELFNGVLMV